MSGVTEAKFVRRQRGIATVELAIVAPIFLLMLLGVAELGRALFQYNTLSKAVRDGARYYSGSVLNTNDVAGAVHLVQYGQTVGGSSLLPGSLPTVNIPAPVIDATGTYVTVSASYAFAFLPGNPLDGILGLFGSALPDPFVLTATTTMRAI
ncbi:MAG: pilus assembly protein [Methylococcaceae bacterium]|nr:pilus assembly protein [Methylococcaceae bacterium]